MSIFVNLSESFNKKKTYLVTPAFSFFRYAWKARCLAGGFRFFKYSSLYG